MMLKVTVLACAIFFNAGLGQQVTQEPDWRLVETSQGPLRGYKASDYDVFEFLNVPYATAPTGLNKFKAPLPPPIWSETFEAVDRRIVCPQDRTEVHSLTRMDMQEDCLVANIYVPNTNQTNLPVLVSVHGGAFLVGWGTMDIAKGFVSSKNIIFVTFNYRLGAHGFLCLGTEDAPGNAGMKDQVALLRWVQKNIASFGGNPNDVSISGCSAGGTLVDMLLLSSMTDGLFNKVIAESACSMNTFSVQLDPIQNARYIARNLGFSTNETNLSALTEFYQTTNILDFFDNELMFRKDSYVFFTPCIEKDIDQPRFLDEAPINILRSGNFKKLPVIYGYAKHEGLFRISQFQSDIKDMNENFSDYLPADLQFDTEAQKDIVANKIKEFYFGNKKIDESLILEYVNFITDVLFLRGILRNINLRVKGGHKEVYLYEYSFTHNGSTTIPHTNGLRGVNHCDQYGLIMDLMMTTDSAPESLSEDRIKIGLTMRNVIFNFITTGNPTPPGSDSELPTWPMVGPNRSPHYSVGHNITVAGIPTENRAHFWDGIYERYGAIPQPPIEIIDGDQTLSPESTPQETTESAEDEQTTKAEPNSATLNNIFSLRFWLLYSIVTLIASS